MLRVRINQAHLKRTLRPLYGWSQTTPKSCTFLRGDSDPDIFPGFAVAHFGGDLYGAMDATASPAGLAGLYVGGDDIDEPLESGIDAFAVWVLGPDAEFEVLAPAFDSTLTWEETADGTDVLIHARETAVNGGAGQLVPAGTANASADPVARLISVVNENKIIVGGLAQGRA